MNALFQWLSNLHREPAVAGLDLDDPQTTAFRKQLIRNKPFLEQIYLDWYARVFRSLQTKSGWILELGSGAGFLQEVIPTLVRSDILKLPDIDLVSNGAQLPFRSNSLTGIVLINVLHHIKDPVAFFREADRVSEPGGRIVMIEPWRTALSEWVYCHLHHEDFDPQQSNWASTTLRPLSDANSAIPWIILVRDRDLFSSKFPEWQIISIEPFMPIRYLLSGGLTRKTLLPAWMYPSIYGLEKALSPWNKHLAMFAHIILEKKTS